MSERDRVKGFFVGTGADPLGAAVEIEVGAEEVAVRIDPMTRKSQRKPLASKERAVVSYMREMNRRLRAESYRKRSVTSNFKTKRKPGVRGDWIKCPTCNAKNSTDCETCDGNGSIWKSY